MGSIATVVIGLVAVEKIAGSAFFLNVLCLPCVIQASLVFENVFYSDVEPCVISQFCTFEFRVSVFCLCQIGHVSKRRCVLWIAIFVRVYVLGEVPEHACQSWVHVEKYTAVLREAPVSPVRSSGRY